MKIYPQALTSNLVISSCCVADDGKEIDKNAQMHMQGVQSYCFKLCLPNMQICDILVAVVAAKAPYC